MIFAGHIMENLKYCFKLNESTYEKIAPFRAEFL